MPDFIVMALSLDKREYEAVKVQEVLTRYGCLIRVRLGVHDAGNACADKGLILLTLSGEMQDIKKLESELAAVSGVRVKFMEI